MSYGNIDNFFHKLEKLKFQLKVLTFLKPNFFENKFISFFFFSWWKFELTWYWKSLASFLAGKNCCCISRDSNKVCLRTPWSAKCWKIIEHLSKRFVIKVCALSILFLMKMLFICIDNRKTFSNMLRHRKHTTDTSLKNLLGLLADQRQCISITWELVSNAESQAPPQTSGN